eukprot:7388551-Prymnesium_polylepis.1
MCSLLVAAVDHLRQLAGLLAVRTLLVAAVENLRPRLRLVVAVENLRPRLRLVAAAPLVLLALAW